MTSHPPDRHHSVEDLIRADWIPDEEVAKAVVWLTCNGHDPEGAEFLARQMLRAAESVRATTPVPDMSDEALAQIIQFPIDNPYINRADLWATMRDEDKEIPLIRARAVRQALTSSTAIVVPDWVTHVEIEFQGPDPTWPNGTRWQEGMGTTVEEAIADASKDGGQ